MQEPYRNKHLGNLDGEIDLRELFHALLEGKWIIVSLTAFLSIVGVIYSLLLPNIYESRAMLVPVNKSSISGSLQNYNALAGLAGINLPSGGDESNAAKATIKISSLSFFENNILKNIYLPDLMALKSWDSETNSLTYDNKIYDTKSKTWTREYRYPQQQIPSAQESYEEFESKHLSLSENKETGFITLSVKHKSPFIAQQWAELIVNEINSFYRQKDKSESRKALSYLNQQIKMTDLSEIKQAIAQLLQEETKKLSLIEANQYYVFDYIDPPAVMEKKSEPNRALICIISFLLGIFLGILIVLMRHYIFSKKSL